jgi:hypothetical protein
MPNLIILKRSAKSWGTELFTETFKQEVKELTLDDLPLQRALNLGSHALTDDLGIMINQAKQVNNTILVRAGVFFSSVIAGCNCADDPSPIDKQSEYCEMDFAIDQTSAETSILLCQ